MDWDIASETPSKNMVFTLSTIGYCGNMPESWTVPVDVSREVAYAINVLVNAEHLGQPHNPRVDLLASQALGHLDKVYVSQTYRGDVAHPTLSCRGRYDVTPFMAALTIDALIRYWGLTGDVRIEPAVKTVLDFLWAEAWVAADGAFWYENCKDKPEDAWPAQPGAPDLNLLIAPAYAWLFERTGNTTYRDRGDAIFAGGVKGAYLYGVKQFNQNYMLSFDYVRRRSGR